MAYVTEDLLVSDGDASKAARTLRDLVDQWYAQGAPQTSSLRATLTRCDTGWQLHVGV